MQNERAAVLLEFSLILAIGELANENQSGNFAGTA
jgi:hypothetical protein